MIIKSLPQVQKFIKSLPTATHADVIANLKDLQENGLNDALVSLRHIVGKLWEIKIDAIRLFYVMLEGDTMILLHAYKKQSQKAPKHEIETALHRMRELFE